MEGERKKHCLFSLVQLNVVKGQMLKILLN